MYMYIVHVCIMKYLVGKYSALQADVHLLKDKESTSQAEVQRLLLSVNNLEKGKANAELELRNVEAKLEEEARRHQTTVAKFNADRKNILSTTEENLGVVKGEELMVTLYLVSITKLIYFIVCRLASEDRQRVTGSQSR